MFPGMFMRKPDKTAALKQLKTHVALFDSQFSLLLFILSFSRGIKCSEVCACQHLLPQLAYFFLVLSLTYVPILKFVDM
ncbi:hypothetical protein K7X08_008811 [Anisodus acutangulus]|uniref:Uncharacterized protein n=1 Tax=Anisodus acutangulus TaxID=402998 RepID=A0A9Q1RQ79_9SOLA|nr:hypothetical protein K7X08_008811 [Anisodus acutangulus]